jgi:NAD(P)-dependent dehydrogenase (short-subunit alcohol dehydrogenase family)
MPGRCASDRADVNLGGVINGLALDHGPADADRPAQSGAIGIVSSVAGFQRPADCRWSTGATKAALINLAQSLYFDLHRAGASACT